MKAYELSKIGSTQFAPRQCYKGKVVLLLQKQNKLYITLGCPPEQ